MEVIIVGSNMLLSKHLQHILKSKEYSLIGVSKDDSNIEKLLCETDPDLIIIIENHLTSMASKVLRVISGINRTSIILFTSSDRSKILADHKDLDLHLIQIPFNEIMVESLLENMHDSSQRA